MGSEETKMIPSEAAPVLLLTDQELAVVTGGLIGTSPSSVVRNAERSSRNIGG